MQSSTVGGPPPPLECCLEYRTPGSGSSARCRRGGHKHHRPQQQLVRRQPLAVRVDQPRLHERAPPRAAPARPWAGAPMRHVSDMSWTCPGQHQHALGPDAPALPTLRGLSGARPTAGGRPRGRRRKRPTRAPRRPTRRRRTQTAQTGRTRPWQRPPRGDVVTGEVVGMSRAVHAARLGGGGDGGGGDGGGGEGAGGDGGSGRGGSGLGGGGDGGGRLGSGCDGAGRPSPPPRPSRPGRTRSAWSTRRAPSRNLLGTF